MILKALLINDMAKLPSKAYPTDTGYDLFLDKPVYLSSTPQACSTGVRLSIPDGYWVRLVEKSGKALKGIQIHGGIIDQSYTGEIKVIASFNGYPVSVTKMVAFCPKSDTGYGLNAGEAICQMILEKRNDADILQITEEELTETDRGANGFGSTNR